MTYHSQVDLARKAGWMKQMWLVIPVVSVLASGDLWRNPLIALAGVAIIWAIGLAAYYLIRICFFPRRRSFRAYGGARFGKHRPERLRLQPPTREDGNP
jgi:hypothetical protein